MCSHATWALRAYNFWDTACRLMGKILFMHCKKNGALQYFFTLNSVMCSAGQSASAASRVISPPGSIMAGDSCMPAAAVLVTCCSRGLCALLAEHCAIPWSGHTHFGPAHARPCTAAHPPAAPASTVAPTAHTSVGMGKTITRQAAQGGLTTCAPTCLLWVLLICCVNHSNPTNFGLGKGDSVSIHLYKGRQHL